MNVFLMRVMLWYGMVCYSMLYVLYFTYTEYEGVYLDLQFISCLLLQSCTYMYCPCDWWMLRAKQHCYAISYHASML